MYTEGCDRSTVSHTPSLALSVVTGRHISRQALSATITFLSIPSHLPLTCQIPSHLLLSPRPSLTVICAGDLITKSKWLVPEELTVATSTNVQYKLARPFTEQSILRSQFVPQVSPSVGPLAVASLHTSHLNPHLQTYDPTQTQHQHTLSMHSAD